MTNLFKIFESVHIQISHLLARNPKQSTISPSGMSAVQAVPSMALRTTNADRDMPVSSFRHLDTYSFGWTLVLVFLHLIPRLPQIVLHCLVMICCNFGADQWVSATWPKVWIQIERAKPKSGLREFSLPHWVQWGMHVNGLVVFASPTFTLFYWPKTPGRPTKMHMTPGRTLFGTINLTVLSKPN